MRTSLAWKSTVLFQAGLLLLVAALTTRYFLERQHIATRFADGLNGAVFGVAIGTLLVSIATRAKKKREGRW